MEELNKYTSKALEFQSETERAGLERFRVSVLLRNKELLQRNGSTNFLYKLINPSSKNYTVVCHKVCVQLNKNR